MGCSACGRVGHSANMCPLEIKKRQEERDARAARRLKEQQAFEAKLANMICFKCGEKGHDRWHCRKLAPTPLVDIKPQGNHTSEACHCVKNQSIQIETQSLSADADVETILPENEDILSPLDIAFIDDSVGDEMSDSSKCEDPA